MELLNGIEKHMDAVKMLNIHLLQLKMIFRRIVKHFHFYIFCVLYI
jgi:hypothetical protein